MNPAVQAVICGRRRQQLTQTFNANATWTAPITTSRIDTASGKGASGTQGGTSTHYYIDTYAQNFYSNRDGTTTQGDLTFVSRSGEVAADAPVPPGNTQGPFATPDNPVYYQFSIVYVYVKTSVTSSISPTTGNPTTAFGKTFPGGVGGAASPTTFSNIAITPGASYNIVVPSGGSLTITYFK